MDWKRHENNIYYKIKEWFEVISKVVQDLDIQPENVYNTDETGVMLSKLGSVKVAKHAAVYSYSANMKYLPYSQRPF